MKKPGSSKHTKISDDVTSESHPYKEPEDDSFFHAMFESHKAIMLLIDPENGSIIDANIAARNFYKYTKEELLQLNIHDINQLNPAEVKQEWMKALRDERSYFVFPHKLADGQIRHVEVYSSPFTYQGKAMLYSIIHDITEKKHAEDALRKSEEKFEIAFRSNPNGLILSDVNTGMIYEVNETFCSIIGLKKEVITGKSSLDLNIYVSHEDRDKMIAVIKSRGKVTNHEIKIRHSSGKDLCVLLSAEFLKTGLGETMLTTIQDITERKKMEEQRKKELELLKIIFDTVPAMISIYDQELKKIELNHEFERVTGWTAADAQEKSIMELAYPDPLYRQEVAEYMQSLEPGFKDILMTCRDGSVKDTLWANVAIGNWRQVGIGIDISERKQAEEELLKSRNIITTALASTTDAVYISDEKGTLIEYNDAFNSFYRIDQGTLFSMDIMQYFSLFEFYLPDGSLATMDKLPIPRALNGEQIKKTEYTIYRKDTGDFWVGSFSFSPIRNSEGKIIGSVVVARDVTDTKKADREREQLIHQLANEKEALAESEERYRIMGEAVEYGVWAADAEGRVTYLSESFCNLVGKTFEELKEHGWHENMVIEQSQEVMQLWMHSIKTGAPYEHEHLIIGKNGEKKHLLARARPIRNQKGEITSWAGIHLDITERKEAAEELALQYKNLRRINEVLEDFVHIAAHDLRSPIGNLISLSELINRQDETEKKVDLFKMTLPITKRLQQTVDALLEMVTLQMEEEVLTKRVSFGRLWNTVEEMLAPEIKDFKGELLTDFSAAPEIVYSDVHLISILRNLVSNAIKYSDDNRSPEITVKTRPENEFILLEISDNGIGIDLSKAKEGLFKPFKRFTKKAGGTGMGLYLIKNIIEKNGGYVTVESVPGQGTTFLCYLKEYPENN